MLFFGIRAAARASTASRSWVRIEGWVSDSPLNGTFGSTINYPLPDGTVHSFRTPSVKGDILRNGRPVRLLVNPDEPTEAHVQGLARSVGPVVVSLVGGSFAFSAVLLILGGIVVVAGSGLVAA